MSAAQVFGLALVALSVGLVAMVVATLFAKTWRGVRARRFARRARTVRPLLLRALDGDAVDLSELRRGHGAEVGRIVATGMLANVRGTDRRMLGEHLESEGLVAAAEADARSGSPRRRLIAIEFLGAVGRPASTAALGAALRDRIPAVRTAAARALGRLGSASAVAPLVDALAAGAVPRSSVTVALLRLGPLAEEGLLVALDHEDPVVRSVTAEVCGSLGLTSARAPLLALVRDRRCRTSAARALGRLGHPDAVPLLCATVEAELSPARARWSDDSFTIAAINALGSIGDRRAIPVYESALGRSRLVALAASEALRPAGPRRSRRSTALRSLPGGAAGHDTESSATDGASR